MHPGVNLPPEGEHRICKAGVCQVKERKAGLRARPGLSLVSGEVQAMNDG